MEKRRVISRKNLPTKLPVSFTALVIIWIDFYEASDILKGVLFTFLAITWITSTINLFTEESKEVV